MVLEVSLERVRLLSDRTRGKVTKMEGLFLHIIVTGKREDDGLADTYSPSTKRLPLLYNNEARVGTLIHVWEGVVGSQ